MRDFLSHQSWIPEKARPKVAAPPSPVNVHTPKGFVEGLRFWVSRNRAWSAAVVAFCVTGGVLLYRAKKGTKKRRARRAVNGARCQVIGENTEAHTLLE